MCFQFQCPPPHQIKKQFLGKVQISGQVVENLERQWLVYRCCRVCDKAGLSRIGKRRSSLEILVSALVVYFIFAPFFFF